MAPISLRRLFIHLITPIFAIAAPLAQENADIIPGKYIVQLKPGITPESIQAHHVTVRSIQDRYIGRNPRRDTLEGVIKTYQFNNFNAYAGSFDEATIQDIASLPEVLAIEFDTMMSTTEIPLPVYRSHEKRDLTTQLDAPWGLGHISHRDAGSTEYVYDSTAGEGTYVYVIDTGIRTTHEDFEGRATWGYNSVDGTPNEDQDGHGTGVASIAVGKTFGVAKRAETIGVKVFGLSGGPVSDVIDGFTWAVNDIVSKGRVNTSVINMSLGGSYNIVWDSALQEAYDLGVMSVVAAGNENLNASTRSPASSPFVMTVGNINRNNVRHNSSPTHGSNWGEAVDIFAPGTDVGIAAIASDTATSSTTGTSQASPHVAGLVCYLRALEGLKTIQEVTDRVLGLATKDVVTDPQGSANLLAYNGSGE